MNNILSITEYNLLDYSLKLQEAVEKGYRISDSVEGSPMMVGFVYATTLVKREDDVVGESNTEVTLMVDDKVAEEQLELPQDVIPVESTPTLDEMLQSANEQCDKVEAVVKEIVDKAPSKRGRK